MIWSKILITLAFCNIKIEVLKSKLLFKTRSRIQHFIRNVTSIYINESTFL
jgi:hypothetical protein